MRLESARAKLAQARLHLETFARREREYAIEIGPLAIPDVGVDGSIIYRRAALPNPPAEFSLIAGDCLQNARSALDHAVYALSKTVNPAFEGTSFPIAGDAAKYRDQAARIRYVPAAHREFIESVQPYNGSVEASQHGLWQLHDLARIDRHRLIPTLVAVTMADTVKRFVREAGDHPRSKIKWILTGGTEPGEPLLKLPPPDAHTVAFEPNWELYIATEEGGFLEPSLRSLVTWADIVTTELESDDPSWPPPESREYSG